MTKYNSIFEKINVLNKINEEIKKNIKLLYVFDGDGKINVFLATNEDQVYCFGNNYCGVLGFGHNYSIEELTINHDLSNKQIIDFKSSGCARTNNGKLYYWGTNRSLGNGRENDPISKPKLNEYLLDENIIDIGCGYRHTIVLTSNKEVYAWGANDIGQIGIKISGIFQRVSKPFKVEFNGEKVNAISCGSLHSMALTESGCVYSWGWSDDDIHKENKVTPILFEAKIKKISCGLFHNLLISSEGNIYVFGRNCSRQLGRETNEMKQLTPIKLNHSEKFIDVASHSHYNISAALSENEIYYVWGLCGEEIISEPKETQFKSFDEIFVHYCGITYKAFDFSDPNKSQIELEEKSCESKEMSENENITQFKNIFIGKEVIGKGSFGEVYKVFHQIEQQFYALKEITIIGVSEEIISKNLKEIQIMAKLRSDYAIHYTTSWIENKNILYIVMELCYNTLREVLKQKQLEFNRKQFKIMSSIEYYISSELFKEILEGINYLHKFNPSIIHRDLKPTNILITFGENGKFVKIADFGLATNHNCDDQTHTEGLGSMRYMAPEVMRGRTYDLKSDIYSLGVITQELFDIDIFDSTNNLIDNPILREKYTIICKNIVDMMSLMKINRPDCEQLLKEINLWYLNLNAIETGSTQLKFDELSISNQSIEKCFHKFFIKTKLLFK